VSCASKEVSELGEWEEGAEADPRGGELRVEGRERRMGALDICDLRNSLRSWCGVALMANTESDGL
jgi:hypothetical protein